MAALTDLEKLKGLLKMAAADGGVVRLEGPAVIFVADAFDELEHLRKVAPAAQEYLNNHPCADGNDTCPAETELRTLLEDL